jgi:Translation initiation factor SUI1
MAGYNVTSWIAYVIGQKNQRTQSHCTVGLIVNEQPPLNFKFLHFSFLSHERAESQFFRSVAFVSYLPLSALLTRWWLLDPFADEGDPLGDSKDVGSQQHYIHIRIQQRNGRKTLTTLQGLPKGDSSIRYFPKSKLIPLTEYDAKKLLKAFKKVSSVAYYFSLTSG